MRVIKYFVLVILSINLEMAWGLNEGDRMSVALPVVAEQYRMVKELCERPDVELKRVVRVWGENGQLYVESVLWASQTYGELVQSGILSGERLTKAIRKGGGKLHFPFNGISCFREKAKVIESKDRLVVSIGAPQTGDSWRGVLSDDYRFAWTYDSSVDDWVAEVYDPARNGAINKEGRMRMLEELFGSAKDNTAPYKMYTPEFVYAPENGEINKRVTSVRSNPGWSVVSCKVEYERQKRHMAFKSFVTKEGVTLKARSVEASVSGKAYTEKDLKTSFGVDNSLRPNYLAMDLAHYTPPQECTVTNEQERENYRVVIRERYRKNREKMLELEKQEHELKKSSQPDLNEISRLQRERLALIKVPKEVISQLIDSGISKIIDPVHLESQAPIFQQKYSY